MSLPKVYLHPSRRSRCWRNWKFEICGRSHRAEIAGIVQPDAWPAQPNSGRIAASFGSVARLQHAVAGTRRRSRPGWKTLGGAWTNGGKNPRRPVGIRWVIRRSAGRPGGGQKPPGFGLQAYATETINKKKRIAYPLYPRGLRFVVCVAFVRARWLVHNVTRGSARAMCKMASSPRSFRQSLDECGVGLQQLPAGSNLSVLWRF